MCRYTSVIYKSHFACFSCRKAFKKAPIEDYLAQVGLLPSYEKIVAVYGSSRLRKKVEAKLGVSYEQLVERYMADVSVCPQCQERMAAMGLDFKPPPKREVDAWQIVQELYEHGFAFRGCGCGVGYTPPARKTEVAAWLKSHHRQTEGERLLAAIARKKA